MLMQCLLVCLVDCLLFTHLQADNSNMPTLDADFSKSVGGSAVEMRQEKQVWCTRTMTLHRFILIVCHVCVFRWATCCEEKTKVCIMSLADCSGCTVL